MEYYIKQACRLCKSDLLKTVLSLANSPLCDAYLMIKKKQKFYPLTLNQCTHCGFVQINCAVRPNFLIREYFEKTQPSGVGNIPSYSQEMLYIPHSLEPKSLKKHFKSYANDVCKYVNLDFQCFVVDIGSNDGTFLSCYEGGKYRVLGIEPSVYKARDATNRGIETLPEFFSLELSKGIVTRYGNASLITINNLFANIDNLHDFTKGLEYLLADDGVLVIESSYLLDMINNTVFDFIYHEHLSYFSIIPLVEFFKKFGMKLIRVEHVRTKGGSLRYYWVKESSNMPVDSSVAECIATEEKALDNEGFFKQFETRIEQAKKELIDILDIHKNQKIIGYGASATSTTLISHFGLNYYLSALVDDNPGKIGTYSPGYHIPVKNSNSLHENPPDVVIILAWRYHKEIHQIISSLNCKIIVPLPKLTILD